MAQTATHTGIEYWASQWWVYAWPFSWWVLERKA